MTEDRRDTFADVVMRIYPEDHPVSPAALTEADAKRIRDTLNAQHRTFHAVEARKRPDDPEAVKRQCLAAGVQSLRELLKEAAA